MANGAKNNGNQNGETRGLDERAAGVANDAGQYIAQISTQIAEEAEIKARQALSDYEKEIEKIVLQSKEELGKKSLEISERIREAILLKAEETSNGLIDRIVADKNKRAEEMASKLQAGKVEMAAETEAEVVVEEEKAKPVEASVEKDQSQDVKDEAVTEDKEVAEDKRTDAEFKSARAAAEFGYKIENLGVQAKPESETGEGQKVGTGDNTTEVVKNGDEADIDDFVRYLSQ
jgi:hypothetical protein